MANPTKQKTWTISPCNRIAFTTLNGVMAAYLFHVAAFLVAHGYTVVGSSDGTAGAFDGVNRWTNATKTTTRATVAAAAQSWILLVDANGCQILITYQGASDDICRISISPSASFVAAGTATNQPTASDEIVRVSGATVIGATASGDRLWSGWVSSDSKLCRFAVASGGVWVGELWGVEQVQDKTANGVIFSPPVWMFGMAAGANLGIGSGGAAGAAHVSISSVLKTPVLSFSGELFAAFGTFSVVKSELQGAVGYPTIPLGIGSTTAGAGGKLAELYDWWATNYSTPHGTVSPGLDFISMAGVASASGGQDGCVWTWDGATTPVMT